MLILGGFSLSRLGPPPGVLCGFRCFSCVRFPLTVQVVCCPLVVPAHAVSIGKSRSVSFLFLAPGNLLSVPLTLRHPSTPKTGVPSPCSGMALERKRKGRNLILSEGEISRFHFGWIWVLSIVALVGHNSVTMYSVGIKPLREVEVPCPLIGR